MTIMPSLAEISRVPEHVISPIDVGFNCWIDLCIWVLEIDGLRVAPFEHHPEFTGNLQQLGLTPSVWRSWFERVVRLQDPMLQWRGRNQSEAEWVEQEIARSKELTDAYREAVGGDDNEIDWLANRKALKQHYGLYQQQLAQTIASLNPILTEGKLEDLALDFDEQTLLRNCPGTVELNAHLGRLWKTYEDEVEVSRYQQLPMRSAQEQIKGQLSEALVGLPSLNIYFTAYASPVELLFPPTSVVTSRRLETREEEFSEFVKSTVLQLKQYSGQN